MLLFKVLQLAVAYSRARCPGDDTLNSIDESITVDGGDGVDTVTFAISADLSGQTPLTI